jgi:AbrB family looped-hinge helix DNA binding protein
MELSCQYMSAGRVFRRLVICLDYIDRWCYRNTIILSIGAILTEVTVSPKYQIVIPKEIRESMGIVSGQKVQIMSYQGRMEVIPLKSMKEMRGYLKGIDTSVTKDADTV